MQHPDLKNGEKIHLPRSIALFAVLMGFLFLIEATPGTQTLLSVMLMLAGLIWYFGDHALIWWRHHHHVGHHH
jgi:uncharacterized membrane protein